MGNICSSSSSNTAASTTATVHTKARQSPYQGGGPERFPVPDDKVPWDVSFPKYAPPHYVAPPVASKPVWADDEAKANSYAFNTVDGNINRKSLIGTYRVGSDGLPCNPMGRTGLKGQGLLGKLGPNHAADPIVTRFNTDPASGKRVLEFVLIKRKDTGEWAFPGGMVDNGENVSLTIRREFAEEAVNSIEADDAERARIMEHVAQLFANGREVYAGYSDDPRNTDSSWMETTAMEFHDKDGSATKAFTLSAGDDAGAVAWVAGSRDLNLFASHIKFMREVLDHHKL